MMAAGHNDNPDFGNVQKPCIFCCFIAYSLARSAWCSAYLSDMTDLGALLSGKVAQYSSFGVRHIHVLSAADLRYSITRCIWCIDAVGIDAVGNRCADICISMQGLPSSMTIST